MTSTPSRPGFLIAGALVFLLLPVLFPLWAGEAIRPRWVGFGIVVALYFLFMAHDSHRRLRATRASAQGSE